MVMKVISLLLFEPAIALPVPHSHGCRERIGKRRRASQSHLKTIKDRRMCCLSTSPHQSFLLMLLFLSVPFLIQIPAAQGSVTLEDATAIAVTSSNAAYEKEIVLKSDNGGASDETLIFRWNAPHKTGILTASLEHTAPLESNKPSWIAFGVFDKDRNTVPIEEDVIDVVRGEAIVGTFFFGERGMSEFSLGNPHGQTSENTMNGGVTLLTDIQREEFIDENLEQGQINLPGGTTSHRTTLKVVKNITEGFAALAEISPDQDNYFLWALGPPNSTSLGMHVKRGAFRLNFQKVEDGTQQTTTTPPAPAPAPATPAELSPADVSNARAIVNATANFQSVVSGPNSDFDHQVQLDYALTLYWNDPGSEGIFHARLEHKAASMDTAPSWLSFGFYDILSNPRPVTTHNFVMAGSKGIIGMPWDEEDPKEYTLGYNHDQPGVVKPIESKHLQDSFFLQFEDDEAPAGGLVYTTLTFKMSMKNPTLDDAMVVAIGENIFMWAMGPPGATSLGMHSEYGAFRLDLYAVKQESGGGDGSSGTGSNSGSIGGGGGTSNPDVTNNPNVASINVIDGTSNFVKSESALFDYQVQLKEGLFFHWKQPNANDGVLSGRLVHTSKFVETEPEWLGVGFPDPTDKSTWMLMKNTNAIIGELPIERVQKYSLGANNNHTNGFVQAMPEEFQTLKDPSILQEHNPDNGIITTTLTFTKLLVEQNNPSEAPIWVEGENNFLWAVGNAISSTPNSRLGMHRDFGGLKLDFAKIAAKETGELPPDSATDSAEDDEYLAPEIIGECSSTLFEKSGKSIQLSPDLRMDWTLNDVDGVGLAEFGEVPSVTIVLEYEGLAWLGFGFSSSARAHSLGSSAVIGIPGRENEPQLKYNITALTTAGTVPLNDQTLIESFVKQDESRTTLRFTKALQDGRGEVPIKTNGLNYFSFAVGSGNSLGYHRHRRSFQLDLSACYDGPPSYPNRQKRGQEMKGKGALTAHAVLAAIAWGFAMPCAIGMAWFRQLIPTTWIYVHVSFNLLTFLLTLVAVILGVGAVSARETSSHFTEGHHWIGLLLFVGFTFQIANGLLRPPVTRKEDGAPVERKPFSTQVPESAREWWHMMHRSMGIIMLLGGIFQIASGMELFDKNFDSGRDNFFWYWTYISVFALGMVFLKIYLTLKNRKKGGKSNWFEDRAATSVGIENSMMASDPDGMDFDGNMVLEIPSRTGESTVIRGARRMNMNTPTASSQHSSTSDLDDDIDDIHLDDTENDEDFEEVTAPEIT